MAEQATVPYRPTGPTVSSLAGLDQAVAVVAFARPDPPATNGAGNALVALAPLEDEADQAVRELARVEHQVNDRLERRAERAARSRALERARHQALEAQVQDAVAQMATTASRTEARLQNLEERSRRAEAELSDLGELQAALDGGLGRLRADLTAVRQADTAAVRQADTAAVRQADTAAVRPAVRKAETAAAPPPPETPAPPRDLGARAAQANAQLDAVSEATDDLLRARQHDSARLATLEKAVAKAVAASARASARTAALDLLRDDVGALRHQLATQQEALDALRKSVDRLGRKR